MAICEAHRVHGGQARFSDKAKALQRRPRDQPTNLGAKGPKHGRGASERNRLLGVSSMASQRLQRSSVAVVRTTKVLTIATAVAILVVVTTMTLQIITKIRARIVRSSNTALLGFP